MDRLGQKRINLCKVVFPGDVSLKKLQSEPRVIELARSIRDDSGGYPIHAPTVDAATNRLISGADRIAALMINGSKSALVELVVGTEQELRRMSIVENLHRRNDDQQRLARQLVDEELAKNLVENGLLDATTKPDNVRRCALPHGAKTRARVSAARVSGKTVGAIERADNREQARERATPTELPAAPHPIRTFGLDVPAKVLAAAVAVQSVVDELSKLATQMAAKLTALDELMSRPQTRAREGLKQAAHAIRSIRPESLCPHCKPTIGSEARASTCGFCDGRGFVPKSSLVDMPSELLATGDDCGVYVDGKWTLL